MKTIKGQPLMSTLEDSQGERRDKQFLEEIIADMPPRFPLGQHHDAALPFHGYIENFQLEEIPDQPGEWRIVGDVYMQDGQEWSQGGFSFSTTEIVRRQLDGEGAIYVPYPYYRDEKALDEILSYDPQLHAGRWIKKAADPYQIALVVSLFILTPFWKKVVDEKVWPFLERVLANYRTGRFKEMPFEFGISAQGRHGETVNLYFIPDRRNVGRTFTKQLIEGGIEKAMKIIAEDNKAATVKISQIKLYYDQIETCYKVDSIQYADGEVAHYVQ
jgi:hypothetical protein